MIKYNFFQMSDVDQVINVLKTFSVMYCNPGFFSTVILSQNIFLSRVENLSSQSSSFVKSYFPLSSRVIQSCRSLVFLLFCSMSSVVIFCRSMEIFCKHKHHIKRLNVLNFGAIKNNKCLSSLASLPLQILQ